MDYTHSGLRNDRLFSFQLNNQHQHTHMIEIKMTIANDAGDEELDIIVQAEFDPGERETREQPGVHAHFYDIMAYYAMPVVVDGKNIFKTSPFELSPKDEKFAEALLWKELKAIADDY